MDVAAQASMLLLKLDVLRRVSPMLGGGKLPVPDARTQEPDPEGKSPEFSDSEVKAADDSEREKGLARSDVTPVVGEVVHSGWRDISLSLQ